MVTKTGRNLKQALREWVVRQPYGAQGALARKLGVSTGRLSFWVTRGQVPQDYETWVALQKFFGWSDVETLQILAESVWSSADERANHISRLARRQQAVSEAPGESPTAKRGKKSPSGRFEDR